MAGEKLLSVSETARTLGVDRQTIGRYLSSGLLRWHGAIRRGRSARGIRVDEARRVLAGRIRDGRNVRRTQLQPVMRKIQRSLSEVPPSVPAEMLEPDVLRRMSPDVRAQIQETPPSKPLPYAPEDVLKVFVAAAAGRADVDFLLYCIERLRQGDQIFVRAVMGVEVPHGWCIGLRRMAADRLRELGAMYPLGEVRKNFRDWWILLAGACLLAPIEVAVAIVLDSRKAKATLELVPGWLSNAPANEALPVIGGHHSVASVRKTRDTDVVNRIVTKVALHLGKEEGAVSRFGASQSLSPLLGFLNEGTLRNPLKWDCTSDCNAGLRAAAAGAGIRIDEARVLLKEWSRLMADVSSRATRSYNDAILDNTRGGSGIRIHGTVVARLLGISRQSAGKWIRQAKLLLGMQRGSHRGTVTDEVGDEGDMPAEEYILDNENGRGDKGNPDDGRNPDDERKPDDEREPGNKSEPGNEEYDPLNPDPD